TQAKVLRVLEQGELEKVGSQKLIVVNVRVIAATNKQLEEEIEQGHFRADLFFRLNVVPIHVPSLRERKEDIPLLVAYFPDNYSRANNFPVKTFAKELIARFQEMQWKGNIRELRNVVERLILMSSGTEVTVRDMENVIPGHVEGGQRKDLDQSLSQLETLKDF